MIALLGAVLVVGDPGSDQSSTGASPGSSDRPEPQVSESVAPETFCAALVDLATASTNLGSGPGGVPDLKAKAQELGDLSDAMTMDDDARTGMAYVLSLIEELDENATVDDLAAAGAEPSIDDAASADALTAWLEATCPR